MFWGHPAQVRLGTANERSNTNDVVNNLRLYILNDYEHVSIVHQNCTLGNDVVGAPSKYVSENTF